MISAPLRTTETLTSKPSIKTHGHLALLEWEDKAPETLATPDQMFGNPVRKSALDRCYDGGMVVLMAVTAAALAASLAQF